MAKLDNGPLNEAPPGVAENDGGTMLVWAMGFPRTNNNPKISSTFFFIFLIFIMVMNVENIGE